MMCIRNSVFWLLFIILVVLGIVSFQYWISMNAQNGIRFSTGMGASLL